MVGRKCLLVDRDRTLIERLGLGIAALGIVELGKIVEGAGDIGVVGRKRLLGDRQRTLIERLGFAIAALGVIELRKAVEVCAD